MLGLPVSVKQFGQDLKREVERDAVFNGAAALAYYLMLAVFPGVIFFLSLLPYLPIENLQDTIMRFIESSLPGDASSVFSGVVAEITTQTKGGLLTFGLLGTIWAATSGLAAVIQQLNITYGVREARSFIKQRLTALMLMVIFSVLMIGAFALILLGEPLRNYLAANLGWDEGILAVFTALRWIIIFAMILSVFAVVYYFGPNVKQKFRFITAGSLFGAISIALASKGFNFYLANFGNYDKTYGSIGGVIVFMLWLYVCGLVLLMGAELNALIEHYHPAGKTKGERVPTGRIGQPTTA